MKASISNGQTIEKLLTTNATIKETMNKKDILTLHNAGIVRKITGKKIIHISDTSIKYLYFLQKGLIKISNISENGEEIIKYFIKPGAIFGELNLLDNEEDRQEVAVAVEDCEVCFIPVETIKRLMEYLVKVSIIKKSKPDLWMVGDACCCFAMWRYGNLTV